jgi:hypothetical protein
MLFYIRAEIGPLTRQPLYSVVCLAHLTPRVGNLTEVKFPRV